MIRQDKCLWRLMLLTGLLGVSALGFALDAAEDTKGKQELAWKKAGGSLALMNGDKIVWQFNHLQDGKEKGCPYFHPLATMEGAVLTDLRPDDHVWHRGLRFAWKQINGLDGYWTWPDGKERWPDKEMGRTDVTAVKVVANDDFSAQFDLELSYHPPGKDAVLTEKRTVLVSAPDKNGNYQIDWRGAFTAGEGGASLERTPILGEKDGKAWGGYAGLQLRVAHREKLKAWTILNSDGVRINHKAGVNNAEKQESLKLAHGKPAKWLDLTLELANGKTGGVTVLSHSDNLRHPAPWHVSSMPNELIYSPLFTGPYLLEEGKKMTFQFRIFVHRGRADRVLLEKQWQAY